ncbi:MAG: hypothetical protein RLN72_10475, partial [Henriciella sp.]
MSSRARLGALAFAAAALMQPALGQIESAGLDDVDSWGVSFLARGEKSFSDRLWLGSDGDYLQELLMQLDIASMTEPEQAVLSRALRSPTIGPDGDAAADLANARLDLLLLMGHQREAATLARQMEEVPEGFDGDALVSDARLASGELEIVCRQMDPAAEGAFWAQLRAICTIEAEDYASAELATEIAAQQDGVEPWFSEVAIAMIGDIDDRPEARYGSGLEYALSGLAGLELTEATVESATPEIAATLARDEELPYDIRLMAADKAAKAGLFSATEHRSIYKAMIAEPEFEPGSAIEAAFVVFARKPEPKPIVVATATGSGPRDLRSMNEDWIEPVQPEEISDDALAIEAVDEISLEEEQALALSEALRQAAASKDDFEIAARLFEPELARLPVNEDTAAGALIFATASLVSGNEKGAIRWLDGLDADELSDAEAFDAALTKGYALILVGQRSSGLLSDVAERLIETGIEPRQQEQALRLFSLWSGFDMPMPVNARMALGGADFKTRRIPSGKLAAIEAASRSGAPGEALFALLSVTNGKPQQLSGADLQTLMQVLGRLGAGGEA